MAFETGWFSTLADGAGDPIITSYMACVTSVSKIQKPAEIFSECCVSLTFLPGSLAGDPIVKEPAGAQRKA